MKKAILAALLTILASPSYAQSVGEKTGVNSVLGIAPKTGRLHQGSRHERPDGDRGRKDRAAKRQCR